MAVHRGIVVACALGIGLAGCNKAPAPETAAAPKATGGVGVVDLDLVAKRLGRDLEMNKAVQERLTTLNEKLQTLRDSLDRLYDEKRTSFGDEPDEDQQKQLLTMQGRMESQLIESKRKAEIELGNYKQALVDQFREQTKPVLRDVAASRGLGIVIPKNNGLLLTIDPAVEITDEVAERLLTSQSAENDEKPRPKQAAAKKPVETSRR